MNVGSVISSVSEGVAAFDGAVEAAIAGDGGEAVRNLARGGLEAAGIGATVASGPAGEMVQETIEGVLDESLLSGATDDVPAPDGSGEQGARDLLSGLVGSGAVSSELGKSAFGELLGAVAGASGGDLQGIVGEFLGDGGGEKLADDVSAFVGTVGLVSKLGAGEQRVADKHMSASI